MAVLFSDALVAPAAAQPQGPSRVDVLVGFRNVPGPAERALVQRQGGNVKHSYRLVPAMAVSIPVQALAGLRNNRNVTVIEPDGIVFALDAELDNAWGVKRIGGGTVHAFGQTGAGVKVAVIDTGIDYTHLDLNTYAGGFDFVNGDADPMDDHYHGTHVAGTVAASDNGFGVVGVAPDAVLYGLKVLSASGSGSWSNIIAALEWAVVNGIQVTNNSYGSSGNPGTIVETAFRLSAAAGIVHIAAAGNSGSCDGAGNTVGYPARYDSVIAVAATNSGDSRACFSSTGPAVGIAAPGVSILSTYLGNRYAWASGTSMASPHVAGVAALLVAAGITDANNNGLINDEVRQVLTSTALDLGAVGRDTFYGFGLVDAAAAVAAALPPPEAHVTLSTDKASYERPTDGSAILTAGVTDEEGAAITGLSPGAFVTTLDGSGVAGMTFGETTPGVYTAPLVLPADAATYTVAVTATDSRGVSGSASAGFRVTVINVPPEVVAGADVNVDEGATFAGDGSFTDPGSDAWDATVDYGDGAGPEPLALDSGQTFTLNHRYADDGSYVVTVTVTDDNGGVGADTLVVTVVNTSPVVDAGPDVSLDEGSTFAGSGSFTDSGSDTWTGSVDYGDGSAVEPLALDSDQTFRLSHTYSSTGVYMVTVRVADDDGGVGTDALTVTWISAAPVVTILEALPAHVDEGSPTLLTATFTDPDAADTHAVDWDLGNGASLPYGLDPGTRTVNLQQTYVDDGSFLVGFRVTDGEGYSDQADVQVEVLNVAPTFEPPLTDLTVGEGTALSVAVTAVDASRVDVLDVSATGIPPGATFGSVTDVGRATGTLAWTPSCEQAGTYTVAFTASDDDGGVAEATLRVTVTDACAAVVAVTNTGDNTVSLIDGGSHQVVNTFSVGLKPVDVAFYDLTFTAAVRALDTHTHVPPVSLYVTDRGQRAVDDKRANGMMRVLTGPQSPEPATAWSFTPYNSMEVGKRPEAMALSPDGSQVWIANWNDDTITIVDRAAYQVIATVPLSRRQASKGRGAGSKTVGRRPTAIAFSADGAFAFVTGRNSNSLVVVSRALATTDPTHAVVAELVVGKQPEVLTVDATGTLAYVATRDGVTVVDVRVPQMPGVVGVLPLPRRLRGIVLSSDGTKLYASNDGADVVSVMAVQAAPTHLAPLGDIDVGMGPAGLAVLPARSSVAGDRVYVACERGHVVSVIDTTTDQVIAMVPVGASPVNVAVGIVLTRLR